MRNIKIIVTFWVLIACIFSVKIGKAYYGPKAMQEAEQVVDTVRSKGNPSAPLKVLEYLDFQCGSCRMASEMIKDYMQRYPDTLFVSAKYFPISGHAHGMRSAMYAECAARQNKFWEFSNKIFAMQQEWSELLQIEEFFHRYATEIGLNIPQLDQCLENPEVIKLIAAEKQAGQAIGISSTPSFIVNGQLVAGRQAMIEYLKNYFNEPAKEA